MDITWAFLMVSGESILNVSIPTPPMLPPRELPPYCGEVMFWPRFCCRCGACSSCSECGDRGWFGGGDDGQTDRAGGV